MMKEAVCKRAAELLVEEDEEQRDLGSFLCKPIGISLSVAGEQPVSVQFAQVVAELIEPIAVRADAETGEDCLVDLAGAPTGYDRSAV